MTTNITTEKTTMTTNVETDRPGATLAAEPGAFTISGSADLKVGRFDLIELDNQFLLDESHL